MTRLNCLLPGHPARRIASVLTLTLFTLAAGFFPVSARAENEGQADLDKATQQKLGAQTSGDLTDVIQLCESALKKGLDKDNTAFANDLMASALVQRGTLTANKAYHADSGGRRRGGDRRRVENVPQRGLGRFGKRRETQPETAAGPIRDRQAEPVARRRSPESDGSPRQDDRAGRRRRDAAGRGPGSPRYAAEQSRSSGWPISTRPFARCPPTPWCCGPAAWCRRKPRNGTVPWPISTSRSRPTPSRS